MLICDCNIYDFELSDHKNNRYFYEIMTQGNLQTAIKKAQKHFTEKFGHKAVHLERNITGYPLCKM